jgi:hypothetical protein
MSPIPTRCYYFDTMPVGFIHLIFAETETGAMYCCGIADAIAAINPARLADFPGEMICPECLQIYGKSSSD